MTGTRVAELDVSTSGRPRVEAASRPSSMREVVAQMREAGAEVLELDVLASNDAARALLRPLGIPAGRAAARGADRRARAAPRAGGRADVRLRPCPDRRRREGQARRGRRCCGSSRTSRSRRNWVRVRSDATDADPDSAEGAREGALVHDRRRRALARRPAWRRRALRPLRPRRRRRRVPVRSRVLRTAAAGRRLRARRERDGRRAADRRRPEARARGGPHRGLARRAAARARSCTNRSRP